MCRECDKRPGKDMYKGRCGYCHMRLRGHYEVMGRKGGKAQVTKGFGTNRKLASLAGRKGGSISRRSQ